MQMLRSKEANHATGFLTGDATSNMVAKKKFLFKAKTLENLLQSLNGQNLKWMLNFGNKIV